MSDDAATMPGDVAWETGLTLDDANVTIDDFGMTFGDESDDVNLTRRVMTIRVTLSRRSRMMSDDLEGTHNCLPCDEEATYIEDEESNDDVCGDIDVTYDIDTDASSVMITGCPDVGDVTLLPNSGSLTLISGRF